MSYLTPARSWLMTLFVLSDKYSGPLGAGALDAALLVVLRRGSQRGTSDAMSLKCFPMVSASLLWSVWTAAERLQRPICQLILLYGGASSAWLSVAFAMTTRTFVHVTLQRSSDVSQNGHDKTA